MTNINNLIVDKLKAKKFKVKIYKDALDIDKNGDKYSIYFDNSEKYNLRMCVEIILLGKSKEELIKLLEEV